MGRLVKVLDYFIPLAIYAFILYAAVILGIGHVGIGWLYLHQKRNYAAVIYVTTAVILCGLTLTFYTKLVFHKPPTPPSELPEALRNKTIVFECIDENGSLARCMKGNCKGRLKPPRAHHCSVCGECRLGFDHHCHWVGNCVTLETRKLFLAFLVMTSVTVIMLASPIRRIAWTHFLEALQFSRQNSVARAYWWDRWYSWILVGGPFGRLPVGAAFGYHLLAAQGRTGSLWELGTTITQPSMSLYLVLLLAIGFALFTFVMGLSTIRDVLRGRATFDRMISKTQGTLYWIPTDDERQSPGIVVPCQPETNPYDLGALNNWKDFMTRPLFGEISQRRVPRHPNATANPLRYSSVKTLEEVHDIDEVWASMLRNVYVNLVTQHRWASESRTNPDSGKSDAVFLKVFYDALLLQPCNSTVPQALFGSKLTKTATATITSTLFGRILFVVVWGQYYQL